MTMPATKDRMVKWEGMGIISGDLSPASEDPSRKGALSSPTIRSFRPLKLDLCDDPAILDPLAVHKPIVAIIDAMLDPQCGRLTLPSWKNVLASRAILELYRILDRSI